MVAAGAVVVAATAVAMAVVTSTAMVVESIVSMLAVEVLLSPQLVATVVVVAFVVAFDEPMMPFGSLVATLLPFSCLIIVLPSLPQEMQLLHSKT